MTKTPEITRSEFNSLNPMLIPPLGDRYLVQKIAIGNVFVLAGGTEIEVIEGAQLDARGNEVPGTDAEGKRGFFLAVICAVGNGHRLENDVQVPMFFRRSDVVICERYTGRELELGAGTYRIVSQVDTLAKVEELSPWEWEDDEPITIVADGKLVPA